MDHRWPTDGRPLPTTDPRPGADVLAALADLQRHLDTLGDDLVAADRLLRRWQGHARERFRAGLVRELAALARLQDDLRRVDSGIRGALDDDVSPTGPWP